MRTISEIYKEYKIHIGLRMHVLGTDIWRFN